jgi:hypothetical protein
MTTPERDRPGGSGPYMPMSPDPTEASKAAVEQVTSQFHREIAQLRELHDKDRTSAREITTARLDGIGKDLERLWSRSDELVNRFTAAIDDRRREIGADLSSATALIDQRLDDLDRAIKLAADQLRDIPDSDRDARCRMAKDFTKQVQGKCDWVMAQIEVVATRMNEKFIAIDGQFDAAKTAVDAALAAAKEAVAEQNKANSAAIKVSEGNTKEQLTSLGQVSGANFKAMEDKITDARDRLTVIEALTRGIKQAGGEQKEVRGLQHGAIQVSIMAGVFVLSIVTLVISLAVHAH